MKIQTRLTKAFKRSGLTYEKAIEEMGGLISLSYFWNVMNKGKQIKNDELLAVVITFIENHEVK